MTIITCPMLDELDWLSHSFYGRAHATPAPLIGIKPFAMYPQALFLDQTFSDVAVMSNEPIPEIGADASITDQVDLALAIKTADCVPLLLVCPKSRLIAAIHASWINSFTLIVPKTIAKMVAHGADATQLMVATGPCLQQKSFAYGSDLRFKFIEQAAQSERFFIPNGDTWLFDLIGLLNQQMRQIGVKTIWNCPIDTYTSADHFSWRQRKNDPANEKSRNISIICKIKA